MSSVTLPNGKRFTNPAALQQFLKENPGTSTPEREESVIYVGKLGDTPECVGRVHPSLEAAVAKAMALVTHQWMGQTPVTPGQSRPVTPSGAFHSPLLSRPQTPLAQSPLASREGTPSRPVSALRLGSTDPVLWQSPTTPGPDVPPSPSRTGYVPTSPFAYGAGADAWSRAGYVPTSPFTYGAGADAWSPSSPMQTMRLSPSATPPHYAPKTPHMPHSVTATVEPWAGLPQHEVSHIVSREPSPEPVVFTQPPLTDELVKSLGTYPDEQRHAPQRRSARLAKRK